MNVVNGEILQSNAFRTLGLGASASQSAIEAAARKMRIWPDPSRVPPTPWDWPSLGPLRRSKSDIERAVALLNQPESRLEQRLLWFSGDVPPEVQPNLTASVQDRHNALIADLQAAFVRPESDDAQTPWSTIIEHVQHLFASSEFLRSLEAAEEAGRFEKRASLAEMAEKAGELSGAITAGVIDRAISALDAGRTTVAVTIGSAVANASAGASGISGGRRPMRDLQDRFEDSFNALARDLEKDLRANLRTNLKQPEPFYLKNLAIAERAALFYRQQLSPVVSAVQTLAANDPDRMVRIKGRCAVLLGLVALAWEWSGKFDAAENALLEALNYGRGTLYERELQQSLGRVGPRAAAERARLAQEARYPGLRLVRSGGRAVSRSVRRMTARPKKGTPLVKRFFSPRGGLIFLSVLAVQALIHLSNSSSSSSSSPYRVTQPENDFAPTDFRSVVIPAPPRRYTAPDTFLAPPTAPKPSQPAYPMPQNFTFGGSTRGR